jgi:hypothetical protein
MVKRSRPKRPSPSGASLGSRQVRLETKKKQLAMSEEDQVFLLFANRYLLLQPTRVTFINRLLESAEARELVSRG